MFHPRRLVASGVAAAATISLFFSGATALASSFSVTPVVTGLQQPRGIAFDGLGGMYVAQAGLPGAGTAGATTGTVAKYVLGSPVQQVWSQPFKSVYVTEPGAPAPDVLGPSGLSAAGNGCTKTSAGVRNGCQILMITSLNSHEVSNGATGHLFALDAASGTATDRADIGDQEYAWALANKGLWEEFPDSNPYGVVITHGGSAASGNTFVIDAGANTVSRVAADGTITQIAFIPNETPAAGLPLRDSTPTCAAQGPDGALYIGTLDFARNLADPNQGWSHVWRVDPNSGQNYLTAAHIWASGVTTMTSCTFDSSGNFWGTEMFKSNPAAAPGDVVRIPFSHPATVEHIGGGQLPLPGGIAQGPDGAMYVTVFSTGTNVANGAVERVATN